MAVICGWEAVIANVGDSCAYMDTGGEVVLVRSTPRPFTLRADGSSVRLSWEAWHVFLKEKRAT
jgi:hypothetical protein